MEYLNGWTKQKVIEKVTKDFKGKSLNAEGKCVYRGPNDQKCIAGIFMLDNEYKPYFDKLTADSKFEDIKGLIKDGKVSHMPFDQYDMNKWQTIHDNKLDDNAPIEEQLEELLKFLD